jgi:lysozyme family protein
MSALVNTSADFRRCHPTTANWEGGWSNHKADLGGKTMYGITEAVFWEWLDLSRKPRRPVASITRAEAEAIFYQRYWVLAGCEPLFPGVDLATYDAAVNSGVSRGRKWLLASLDKGDDHARTVKTICAKRLSFVQSLKVWETFGKGWGNRIADVEARGVAFAMAAMTANDNSQIVARLEDEATGARKTAGIQTKGATATGAAGAGSGGSLALDPATADQLAGYVLGGILVMGLLLAAFLLIRARINAQRAKAYGQVALEATLTGAV